MTDEQQCKEHRAMLDSLCDDIKEIRIDTKGIKNLMHGNGKVGVAEMARRSFEHMAQLKASKNGFIDWLFRTAIFLMVSAILGILVRVVSK